MVSPRPVPGPAFAAACLVPGAPLLVRGIAGTAVPGLDELRAAVEGAVAALLRRCDEVVVAARSTPGTLDGFGRASGFAGPASGSWSHDLGAHLLADRATATGTAVAFADLPSTAGDAGGWLVEQARGTRGRVGLLVLADGSTTRGPRAPGGEDPLGEHVDAELVAALRQGRPPVLDDGMLLATGCTGAPGVAVMSALSGGAAVLGYSDAPFGVGYVVASWSRP